MKENQFLKLNLSGGGIVYINVDNITHVKLYNGIPSIYVIGKESGVKVKESLQDIERMLPSTLSIDEVTD